ncbi:hypothetical protein IV102_10325 [bacterium]|nr:hypothetical protein [bacterium]
MKFLCLFLLLIGVAIAEPKFQYDKAQVKTLVNQGDPSKHIDLVFVGDGYTPNRSSELERDARDAADSLWKYPLFKDYKQYFNVHLVSVPSIQEGQKTHYAFGSETLNNGQGTVDVTKENELKAVAAKAPGCDVIIVLTTMLGRAHAGDFIVLPGRSFEPLPHELGHKLGKLGDEYSSESSLADRRSLNFGSGDIPYPNLTLPSKIDPTNAETIKKTAKWGHFLELPGAFPLVSAYQGGFYRTVGVWRPTFACIMDDDGAPFCPVCHEEMVKAIYAKCGVPFDDKAYHRRHPLSQWR